MFDIIKWIIEFSLYGGIGVTNSFLMYSQMEKRGVTGEDRGLASIFSGIFWPIGLWFTVFFVVMGFIDPKAIDAGLTKEEKKQLARKNAEVYMAEQNFLMDERMRRVQRQVTQANKLELEEMNQELRDLEHQRGSTAPKPKAVEPDEVTTWRDRHPR